MENIKKYITGIICCLLAVFVMSHNTYAVVSDEVQWVNSGYNNMNVYANGTVSCTSNCDFVINNNADTSVGIQTIQFGIQSGQYYQNQIIQFNLTFWKVSSNTSIHANFNSLQVIDNASIKFYDLTFDNIDSNTFIAHIYLRVVNDVYISNRVQVQGVGSLFMFLLQPTERVSANSWTLWQIADTAPIVDTNSIVNAIQAQPNYQQSLNNIRNDIQDVADAIENQNQEEQEAVQDASDEAATEADENSTNQQTSNLIGVLQNFLNAITNFQATDCNIDLAFPQYAGGTIRVNVCQYKDKAGNIISVFTSLTLIVFYLPLAIKLLSMIYNEIRSFTNG